MATSPQRFCLKRKYLHEAGYKNLENWIYTKNNVYIARLKQKYVKNAESPSKWEIPFPEWGYEDEEIHRLYEEHLRGNSHLMESLSYLSGKNLGCWCEPGEHCHADIIINVYNEQMKMVKKEKLKNKNEKKRKKLTLCCK